MIWKSTTSMSAVTMERRAGQLCETRETGGTSETRWDFSQNTSRLSRASSMSRDTVSGAGGLFSILLGDLVENSGLDRWQRRGLAWRTGKNDW